MSKVFLCKKDEIQSESSRSFEIEGKKIVVFRTGDDFFAYRNVCLHQGGPLSYDEFQKTLTCAWHGAEFNTETGEALTPPAPVGSFLPKIELKITKEEIYLDKNDIVNEKNKD